MNISEVVTGRFTCENDPFSFSKTAKRTNNMCITCTIVPGLGEMFYFFNPVWGRLTRAINVKVTIEIYYIFTKISKLKN